MYLCSIDTDTVSVQNIKEDFFCKVYVRKSQEGVSVPTGFCFLKSFFMLSNITINQWTCYELWKEHRSITGWHLIVMEAIDYLIAHNKTKREDIDGVLYNGFTYDEIQTVIPMFPMPENQMLTMLLDMAKAELFTIPEETLKSTEDTLVYYANVGPRQYALSFGEPKILAV